MMRSTWVTHSWSWWPCHTLAYSPQAPIAAVLPGSCRRMARSYLAGCRRAGRRPSAQRRTCLARASDSAAEHQSLLAAPSLVRGACARMCMLGLGDEASEGRQRANNAMRSSRKEQRERRGGERAGFLRRGPLGLARTSSSAEYSDSLFSDSVIVISRVEHSRARGNLVPRFPRSCPRSSSLVAVRRHLAGDVSIPRVYRA